MNSLRHRIQKLESVERAQRPPVWTAEREAKASRIAARWNLEDPEYLAAVARGDPGPIHIPRRPESITEDDRLYFQLNRGVGHG